MAKKDKKSKKKVEEKELKGKKGKKKERNPEPAPAAVPAPEAAPAGEKPDAIRAVSIKIPASRLAAIDAAARAYGDSGVSRSEYIRAAIDAFMEK